VEPELEPLAAFKGEVEPRFGGFTSLQLKIHQRSYFAKRLATPPEELEPEPFLEEPEPCQTGPWSCSNLGHFVLPPRVFPPPLSSPIHRAVLAAAADAREARLVRQASLTVQAHSATAPRTHQPCTCAAPPPHGGPTPRRAVT
jgi:hypothetical protein